MAASLAVFGCCDIFATSWLHLCVLPWDYYPLPGFSSCLIKQLGLCVTDTCTFQIQISGRALHAEAVFLIKPFSYCSLPKSKLGYKRFNRCNTFTPDDVREPLYPSNRWADLLASKFGMTSKVYHVKPDAISTLQFCKNALVLQKAITEMCKENMRSEPLPAPAFCSWHLFPQSEEPNVEAFLKRFQGWDLVSFLPTCVFSRKTAEQQRREDESYCGTENESPVDLSIHVFCLVPILWPCCDPYFKGAVSPSQITASGSTAELASELSGMSSSFTIHMK